jgi:hypothetical protein
MSGMSLRPAAEVGSILAHGYRDDEILHLVRWKGCGQEEDTWEREETLIGERDFLRNYWLTVAINANVVSSLLPQSAEGMMSQSPFRIPVSSREELEMTPTFVVPVAVASGETVASRWSAGPTFRLSPARPHSAEIVVPPLPSWPKPFGHI